MTQYRAIHRGTTTWQGPASEDHTAFQELRMGQTGDIGNPMTGGLIDREAAIVAMDAWMDAFGAIEIKHTSAREYACGAVMDMREAISALPSAHPPQPDTDARDKLAAMQAEIERLTTAKERLAKFGNACQIEAEEIAGNFLEQSAKDAEDLATLFARAEAAEARVKELEAGVTVKQLVWDTPIGEVADWLLGQATRDYRQHEIDALRCAGAILAALSPATAKEG